MYTQQPPYRLMQQPGKPGDATGSPSQLLNPMAPPSVSQVPSARPWQPVVNGMSSVGNFTAPQSGVVPRPAHGFTRPMTSLPYQGPPRPPVGQLSSGTQSSPVVGGPHMQVRLFMLYFNHLCVHYGNKFLGHK